MKAKPKRVYVIMVTHPDNNKEVLFFDRVKDVERAEKRLVKKGIAFNILVERR